MAPDSNFWHVAEVFIAQLGERQTEDLEAEIRSCLKADHLLVLSSIKVWESETCIQLSHNFYCFNFNCGFAISATRSLYSSVGRAPD